MKGRRLLATLMALVMCLSLLPGAALAGAPEVSKNVKVLVTLPKDANGKIVSGTATARFVWKGDDAPSDADINMLIQRLGTLDVNEWEEILFGTIEAAGPNVPSQYGWSTDADGNNVYAQSFPFLSNDTTGELAAKLNEALAKEDEAAAALAALQAAQQDKQDADDAVTAAQAALEKAQQDKETAESGSDAEALAAAQAALQAAQQDKNAADEAATAAQTALNEAKDAKDTADSAVTTAQTALTTAGESLSNFGLTFDGVTAITDAQNALKKAGLTDAQKQELVKDCVAKNTSETEPIGWSTWGGVRTGDKLRLSVWENSTATGSTKSKDIEITVDEGIDGVVITEDSGSGGGGGGAGEDVTYSATVTCKTNDGSALPAGVSASETVTWQKSAGETKTYTPASVSGWTVSPASATLQNNGTAAFTYTRTSSEVVVGTYSATVTFTSANNTDGTPPTGVNASETVTWQSAEGATKAYTPASVPGYSVSPANATLENGKTYAFTYSKLDLVTANGGYTLTVNYLMPVGPRYGNLQVGAKTEFHKAGEAYNVPSIKLADMTPSEDPVTGTMPASNLTVNVVYSPLYTATVHYVLASDATAPSSFLTQDRTENLKNGEAYYFPVPSYDGLVADRTEVEGNIVGANAEETVTYKKNDFTVIVKYQSGGNVSSDNLVSFMEQAGGYAQSGYRNGQRYSVPSPSYYGVRPLKDKVEGFIEWEDVEEVVYYTDACTNPGGHNWVVTHEGQTHKEKCQFCGIEKAPQTTEVTYLSLGENKHSVQCGVCGADLREEECTASTENNAVGSTACSGKCANCGGTFDYGDEHDYAGQKWAPVGSSTHGKTCVRCGHVETESCNALGWAHQGSGAGAQHATACSVCGQQVGAWQACSYTPTKISGGRHTALCVCGRGNGTEKCTYVLKDTTASAHTYECTGCHGTVSGAHTRKTCRENEKSATKYSYASYTLITYCGRCDYTISSQIIGGGAKKLPVEKLTKEYTKKHFNYGGGGGSRRGDRRGGGGGGSAAAYSGGNNVVQQQALVDPLLAGIVSSGLDDYLFDNYDTLLLPAEDALEAYFAEHPEHMGEGWSIDLEPALTLTMTSYDEAAQTLTVDISATYGVRLSNEDGSVDVLIGQNYPLSVDFAIDLEFDIPGALAVNGNTLYVRHNHNGTYHYYTATVNAANEDYDLPTASFTASAGLSTFELRTTAWDQSSNNNSGNNSGSGSSSGGGGGGSSSSSSSSDSKTESKTDASGSKVESKSDTTTVKNADGSTTATTRTTDTITAVNGDKTEKTGTTAVTTKTNADGSVTETTKATETATTTAANGAKTTVERTVEAQSTTKATADGGKTTTEKATETTVTTAADGVKTTTETRTESTETLDRSGNGTLEATKTETVKDASGKVTETTVTESRGKVETAADGTRLTTLTNTAVTTNAATGEQTTVVTTEQQGETPDGTTAAVVQDASGNALSAQANVSAAAVEQAQKSGETVQIPVTMPAVSAASASRSTPMQIELPAPADGGAQEKVYVEIGVEQSGPGIIAMQGGKPVKECYEGSVILPVYGSCEIVIVDNTKTFDDVSGSSWYSDNVTFVAAREIFNGTGDGQFSPESAMTRGMLAQVLYNFDRSATAGNASAFADATGKWYASAAGWANSAGVVTGTQNGFEGEANVTREQVATMLYRYAKSLGLKASASADLSAYQDADSVSDWARDAMRWAVGAGLINGSNGRLDPQGNATRAQLAAIMQRFCEKAMR